MSDMKPAYFRNKRGESEKQKLMRLKPTVRTRTSETFIEMK
jgi:hypothetical protein